MTKKAPKPFVDFRDIRSRITMEQLLQHYGILENFKRSGSSLTGSCPIHKGTNKSQFKVDTDRNIWKCFSECHHGGNTLDFICRMENLSIHDAALKACEWFDIPVEEVKSGPDDEARPSESSRSHAPNDTKAETRKIETRPVSAPDDNKPNPPLKFKLDKLQREHPYLTQERGLTLETIIDFGLGYFTGDKGIMVGHVVIPIHNFKGELVAYAGRWLGVPPDKDAPKYKLPGGFKKSQELFNLHNAAKQPAELPLMIVEGFFDAIKLHQHGCRKVVALMGSSLSVAQEELIQQSVTAKSRVIVMLDEDAAGCTAREEIAARLAKFCFVKIHVFEQPGAQPESLLAGDVARLLEDVP
jgi:DNA primase